MAATRALTKEPGRDAQGRFVKGNRAGRRFRAGNKIGRRFQLGNWGIPGKVPGQRDPRLGQARGKPVMEAGAEAEVGAVVEPVAEAVAATAESEGPGRFGAELLGEYRRRDAESRERARLMLGRGRRGHRRGVRVWGKNGRGPAVYRPQPQPVEEPPEPTVKELIERKVEELLRRS